MKYILSYNKLIENKINDKILSKIDKFFKCEYVAKKAVELHPKLAIWIINTFKDYVISDQLKDIREGGDEQTLNDIKSYFNTGSPKQSHGYTISNFLVIKQYWEDLYSKYQSIVDWTQSNDISIEDRKNLLNMTLSEAFKKSEEWHNSLKAGGVIEDEHGDIIMKFPDGFYWIDLKTCYDRDEANAMGHCGRTNKGDTIYSLRDRGKHPHVTLAIDTNNGIIYQMKGRNNKKPIDKYHKYIVNLLINDDLNIKGFGNEYNKHEDFSPDDLDKDLYKILIEKKPDINDRVFNDEEINDMFERMIDSYYLEDVEYAFSALSWVYDLNKLHGVINCINNQSPILLNILCDEYPDKLEKFETEMISLLNILSTHSSADDAAKYFNIKLPNIKDSNSNKWNFIAKYVTDSKLKDYLKYDGLLDQYNKITKKTKIHEYFSHYNTYKRLVYEYENILNYFFDDDVNLIWENLQKLFDHDKEYTDEIFDVWIKDDILWEITTSLTVEEKEKELSNNSYYEYEGDYY